MLFLPFLFPPTLALGFSVRQDSSGGRESYTETLSTRQTADGKGPPDPTFASEAGAGGSFPSSCGCTAGGCPGSF